MSDYVIMPKAHYEAACNAIRSKTGKEDKIPSGQLEPEILGITTGGGSSEDVRYVTFMSYDGSVEYGRIPVAVGYDCPNPKFDDPTRESTVQYNYTFAGWATEANGGLDSNALKAVTEDRTVYANYISSVRYYAITYYDSDGTTVLKTENLAYGTMPTYIAEKSGFNFDGWHPELATVTCDASYQALFSEKLTFAGASWADIARVSEAGEASKHFAVGDTKNVVFNGETISVAIAGFNHDTLSDGSGKAGISIVCMTMPSLTARWHKSSSLAYYPDSELFNTMESWEAYLPAELAEVIKKVTKECDGAINSGTHTKVTAQCKLWPLSLRELGWTNGNTSFFTALGSRYTLFPAVSTSYVYPTNIPTAQVSGSTNKMSYFLRQLRHSGTFMPIAAGFDGGEMKYEGSAIATTYWPIRFGFCI